MTQVRERSVVTPRPTRFMRAWEWITGVVGLIVTVLGAWILAQPEEGILSLFGWEWGVGTMHAAWPITMIVLGVLAVLFAGAALLADRD